MFSLSLNQCGVGVEGGKGGGVGVGYALPLFALVGFPTEKGMVLRVLVYNFNLASLTGCVFWTRRV